MDAFKVSSLSSVFTVGKTKRVSIEQEENTHYLQWEYKENKRNGISRKMVLLVQNIKKGIQKICIALH